MKKQPRLEGNDVKVQKLELKRETLRTVCGGNHNPLHTKFTGETHCPCLPDV